MGGISVIRALFIGNSYTYCNDLPLMFIGLAAAMDKALDVDSSTAGGYTLASHLDAADPVGAQTLGKLRALGLCHAAGA